MKLKMIKITCAVLGWLYRERNCEDGVSAYIEHGINKLTCKYNDIIDQKRNKYIEKNKTVSGCIERYQYITSWQYLHGSRMILIEDDEVADDDCKL